MCNGWRKRNGGSLVARITLEEFIKRLGMEYTRKEIERIYMDILDKDILMLDKRKLVEKLKRLQSLRAGSIYTEEQEEGMIIILKEILEA